MYDKEERLKNFIFIETLEWEVYYDECARGFCFVDLLLRKKNNAISLKLYNCVDEREGVACFSYGNKVG